jgi:hypothetical protein
VSESAKHHLIESYPNKKQCDLCLTPLSPHCNSKCPFQPWRRTPKPPQFRAKCSSAATRPSKSQRMTTVTQGPSPVNLAHIPASATIIISQAVYVNSSPMSAAAQRCGADQ